MRSEDDGVRVIEFGLKFKNFSIILQINILYSIL